MSFYVHLQALWLIPIVLLTVYVVAILLYRITFHALAKFPGPNFSKLTGWSIVRQAASGDRHLETWKEHQQYGSVVRIAPNTLSFNTASALKAIYTNDGRKANNVRKADWYRTIDAGSKAFSTHSEIDRSRHARRRRIMDRAFSDSAIAAAEEFVLKDIKIWVRCLAADADDSGWTSYRNMKDWCNWLSFDMMGDLTFGRNFGCVEKGEHRFVPAVVLESTKFVYVAGFWPFIALVRPLFGTLLGATLFSSNAKAKDNAAYVSYANSLIAVRMAAENQPASSIEAPRADFSSHLLRAREQDPSQSLTINELYADSALLIHAGSDTTALTISATLFYLLHNPPILAHLTTVIRTSFHTIEFIHSGPLLNSLTYLRACIDETLRMAPPVPSHLPREVLQGGIEIDGHHFPAGTVVGVAPWAIHHNPEYFPDPFSYNPERWIITRNAEGTDNEEQVRLARSAFCPFSLGSRGCAGKRLAYLEVSLAIAVLLWTFDMRLAEDEEDEDCAKGGGSGNGRAKHTRRGKHGDIRGMKGVYQLWDHFVADREGPVVQFRRRRVE